MAKKTDPQSEIDDLQKQIDDIHKANEKKREQIASEQQTTAQREAKAAKELELIQLKTESARLDLQMAEVTRANSAEDIQAGASAPLSAARAEMEALLARAEATTTTTETAVTVVTPEQVESDTKEK